MTDSNSYSDDAIAIGETAKMLGVSVKTVRNWEARGLISALRTPTGHRRFRRSDVERLLQANDA
ncbi:MerR family DNA-binding transcriptional regulator [Gordonia sp. HY442]|uniref:MerR family transcriptional regulator n=1 Tax=Gordonia zhenghanii TaxID=2911516 RepID=UPI001EFFEADB|nr:MerR family DNA-binding transcriptional regulator [Gordonia zhenghanii]MCF8605116.1 MerR family DNA-binding transcriptional regulator [Gordonia zhenghanii]